MWKIVKFLFDMNQALLQPDHYKALLDELDKLEGEAKWDLTNRSMWWAHACGETIRRYAKGDITKLLPTLAVDTGISERTLWRRVEFYDKFPDLQTELDKHGKDVSMSKLLGAPKAEKEEKDEMCTHFCKDHAKLFEMGKSIGGSRV